MLRESTVFILGAGASHPYGFPTGLGLLEKVLSLRKKRRSGPGAEGQTMYECIRESDFTEQDVSHFARALAESGRVSVDAFLEGRPEFVEIGKLAMAATLLPCVSHAALYGGAPHSDGRWYTYFFTKLASRLADWGSIKAKIVTFNYDRSLEYYLTNSLEHSHKLSLADAQAHVLRLGFVHLYGDLGPITDTINQWRMPKPLTPERVQAAAKQIRIISDEHPGHSFDVARNFIANAKVVVFLGFGYHEVNVTRLLDSMQPDSGKSVIGSAYAMGQAEMHSARALLSRVYSKAELGADNQDVLRFLRDKFVWW